MHRKVVTFALIPLSIIFGLALSEGILRTGLLDDYSLYWFPPHYRAINEARLTEGRMLAHRNPLKFREFIQGPAISSGKTARIAVLGDSFIWGHGLHYADSWVQQFKAMVGDSHPSIEVLPWGLNGWSTLEELEFLKIVMAQNKMFEADLLMVGFVVNDPDLRDGNWEHWRKEIKWSETWFAPLGSVFPYTWGFLTGHIDALLEIVTDDHGHRNWMKNLWSEDNLAKYTKVLQELKSFAETMDVPVLMVITPKDANRAYFDEKLDRITALFDQVGLKWINLFGFVEERFGDTGAIPRLYWANPANSHPGPEINAVMAATTYDHLLKNGTLDRLSEKRKLRWVDRVLQLPECKKNYGLKSLIKQSNAPESGNKLHLGISGVIFILEQEQVLALKAVAVETKFGLYPALYGTPIELDLSDGRKVTGPFGFFIDLPYNDDGKAPQVTRLILETKDSCHHLLQAF